MAVFRPEQIDIITGSSNNDKIPTQGYGDDNWGGITVGFEAYSNVSLTNTTGKSASATDVNPQLTVAGGAKTITIEWFDFIQFPLHFSAALWRTLS